MPAAAVIKSDKSHALCPAPGTADESGTLDTTAQIPCTYTENPLFVAQALAPGNVQISSRPVVSPCPIDD